MRKLTEQDLTAVVGIINAGYTIERARVKEGECTDSDHYGIALARSGCGKYVTWQFHLECDDERFEFYWGKYYMEDMDAAIKCYETRS
jgi:hypothetical protein